MIAIQSALLFPDHFRTSESEPTDVLPQTIGVAGFPFYLVAELFVRS
jgi:hypothetical protein